MNTSQPSAFAAFKTPKNRFLKSVAGTSGPKSGPKSASTIKSYYTVRSNRSSLINPSVIVVAIAEGRGQARGEVGLACLGLSTPNLILCQLTDGQNFTKTITKLNIFQPSVILMPANSCDSSGQPSRIFTEIKKSCPTAQIVPIQRKAFNDAKGLQRIKSLVVEQFASVILTISKKYYALAAAFALLKYAELVHSVLFSPNSLRMEFQGYEKSTLIDSTTAQHLELLQNNSAPTSNNSLLGILSTCRTPMGCRLLRTNILQPPCDEKFINQRLDCVEEIKNSPEFFYGLQAVLSRLPVDLDHVIAGLILIPKVDNEKVLEQRLNFIIALKHTLELVPTFMNVLSHANHQYFQCLKREFEIPVYDELVEKIQSIVNDEAQITKGASNMQLQRTFAVKADVNAILDVARKVYCEIRDDVNQYVLELSKEHDLPFRLYETVERGFHIQFTLRGGDVVSIPRLPPSFLQVHRSKNVVSFTTETLLISDRRAKEILQEIQNISFLVISQLIVSIRGEIGSLYKISEAIANLDILQSFATYVLTTNAIRPKFSNTLTAISSGKNPILDSIASDPTTPNDTFLSTDTNFLVITGPNMSGKTTYLKQVATLQVMAQIGSFVPAKSATFRVAKCIFSRIGTGDSIEENASSFALEMTEMNYILTNLTDNSLVIIDELGRATSVEEGTAISWALAEELMSSNAFTLFATHFLFLTKMESLYLNVLNYRMETKEWSYSRTDTQANETETGLKYTHILCRGITEVEYYGLKLARKSSYLPSVVNKAHEIATNIIQSRQKSPVANNVVVPSRSSRYILASQLVMAAQFLESDNPEIVRNYLKELQTQFTSKYGQCSDPQNKNNGNPQVANKIEQTSDYFGHNEDGEEEDMDIM